MKWIKVTFVAALAIIFVGTAFIAIFGAGKVIDAVFSTYVFRVEMCQYGPVAKPVIADDSGRIGDEFNEECFIDYNSAKRDISSGFAMFLVSLPIAYLSYRQLMRSIKSETNENKTA